MNMPPEPQPQPPVVPPVQPKPDPDYINTDWKNTIAAHHNVRAICDLEGISGFQLVDGHPRLKKDILTACVYQESNFRVDAMHKNTNGTTDWGICQYNDGKSKNGTPFWIGPGAALESVHEVLTNPEKCLRVMCRYYKATGHLNPWVSYNSGAYKKYLGKV